MFILCLFIGACKSDPTATVDGKTVPIEEKNAAISQLENEIEQKGPDPEKMEELMKLYETHVEAFPEKEGLNVSYLLKAGELARAGQHYDKAIQYYSQIIRRYGSNEKADKAWFLKAFTFDEHLHQLDSAKYFYEQYLSRYPKGQFADDAQATLKNLGKTPEEIVKEFEEKGATSEKNK